MKFVKRTTEPTKDNKYYKHISNGGLNSCIEINNSGSVLHNCVGYSFGRSYELMNNNPKLSRGNAEDWYNYNDGYKRGKKPKLGAIVCWRKGEVRNSKDGYGHVANVEEIYEDGSFLISQSGYTAKKFWTQKIPANGYNKGYIFQGFIYLPVDFEESKPIKNQSIAKWQTVINKTYKENLAIDGSYGKDSRAKANKHYLRYVKGNVIVDNYVIWLQEELNFKGANLVVDGSFGGDTERALKNFQKQKGLAADGKCGAETVDKLLK